MKRSLLISEYMVRKTKEAIESSNLKQNGVDAFSTAQDLSMDRANVSKELNKLWRDGRLIKILGRPVTYFDTATLTNAYSVSYLPSTIGIDENLESYLSNEKSKISTEHIDELDKLVGAKDSLSSQVRQAKAAVSYPPNGLATLIIGNIGVGKWKFASYMAEYAKAHGFKSEASSFVRLDCGNFKTKENDFSLRVFGAAKGYSTASEDHYIKGALEETNNGILYLDNLDMLNPYYLDQLIEMLEKNVWSRNGETLPRPLKCMIIAGTCTEDSDVITTIANHFPIHIHIPDLDARNINEKIELILDCFSEEAVKMQYPIRFHKDVLFCFTQQEYKKNLADLNSEIRQACSKAYLDAKNSSSKTVFVSFQHLSNSLLSSHTDENNQYRISLSLSLLDSPYILITAEGQSTAIDYFRNLSEQFDDKRLNQFVSEFAVDLESVDNLQNYCVENITCLANIGKAQSQALRQSINPQVINLFSNNILNEQTKSILSSNSNLLYGVLLHITNLIKRADNLTSTGKQTKNTQTSSVHSLLPEYSDAQRVIKVIEKHYNVSIPEKEIDFLTQYLNVADNWFSSVKPSLLLIGHGEGIASSIAKYVTDNYPNIKTSAINFNKSIQFNDVLELASLKAKEIDNGIGVLIIADYEPLLSISDHLRSQEGIRSRTISPLSLNLVEECIAQIQKGSSLDQLAQYFSISKTTTNDTPVDYQTNFIQKITDEYLATSLTFLNPTKAVNALLQTLNSICQKLNRPVTNEITVKFIYHGVNMLERVIAKQPLAYEGIKVFSEKNRTLMRKIEKSFVEIEELFGIHIPESEIAFITEIFLFDEGIQH